MGNPYNSQSINGYNVSPPSDDGSQTAANQLTWAKHKDKLADPLKTLTEGINTEVLAAFGKLPYYTSRSVSSNETMLAADERKVISFTNSPTYTLLPAATAGNGFTFLAFNAGTGTITLDPDGSETIDGASTYTLIDQYQSALVWTNGTTWFVIAEKTISVGLPLGYFNGLELSNGTDTQHDIDVTAGECRGADDDEDITLSAITKQADATWVAGTNQGGLSSSLTLSADTLYYVHAIKVAGAADVGFDTSATAANLVADHSATAYREIGRFKTDSSSNIINNRFVQTVIGGQKQTFEPQASTSGTEIDFLDILDSATEIDVLFDGISTNGTDEIIVQIGDSGGIETSGYSSSVAAIGGTNGKATQTAGFAIVLSMTAAIVMSGKLTLTLLDSANNTWVAQGHLARTDGFLEVFGGSKSLSATLDRLRITTVVGSDTFDAGSVNIRVKL